MKGIRASLQPSLTFFLAFYNKVEIKASLVNLCKLFSISSLFRNMFSESKI